MSRRNAQHFERQGTLAMPYPQQGETALSPQPTTSKLQEAILK
jgi:hypothetical protein